MINFGMWNIDLNEMLIPFFDPDWLSKLHLTENQIIRYANILNWDILSTRNLSPYILDNYPINWPVYYMSEGPRHLFREKILSNEYIFRSVRMKKRYYDNNFINVVPEIVDWQWCVKNVQLSQQNLLLHWDKLNINLVCKHQNLTNHMLFEKRDELNWTILSKKELSEDIIYVLRKYVDWSNICRYQVLSSRFIDENYNSCDIDIITQYQVLDEWFIRKHRTDIDKDLLCRYQNLQFQFLKENTGLIRINSILQNENYNNKNTLQITQINGVIYIIEPPMTSDKVVFCKIEYEK